MAASDQKADRKNAIISMRGRGDPVGRIEVHRRLTYCERLMADGHDRLTVYATMRRKFGVAPRTAERYCHIVREKWLTAAALRDGTIVEQRISHMQRLIRKLEAKEAWGPLAAFEKHLDDLLGSKPPERVDVRAAVISTQVGEIPQTELNALSDEFLLALVEESKRLASQGPQLALGAHEALEVGSDDPDVV